VASCVRYPSRFEQIAVAKQLDRAVIIVRSDWQVHRVISKMKTARAKHERGKMRLRCDISIAKR
jgi:hypothetical protein